MMLNSKTDIKNIQLLKLLAQLRDHIDVHRIIGLNVADLQESQISGALLGYLQKSAHESLALYFSKIFEASSRNDLNSIPGIIESIPAAPSTEMQKRKLAAFGSKYGHEAVPADARSYLTDTFARFRDAHLQPIARLKEFRDTIGAHSDYCANITSLPSHAEFCQGLLRGRCGIHHRERACCDSKSSRPRIRPVDRGPRGNGPKV